MRTFRPMILGLAALCAVAHLPVALAEEGMALKLTEAIALGRPMLEVRPRHARIGESLRPEDTDVWTLRVMAGWQTLPWHGIRLTAQYLFTDVYGSRLNADPGNFAGSRYPLLPDPATHGVNQFFADFTSLPATRLRAGRQVLRVDDERFISDVDFRQTPQVFDGALLTTDALPGARIQLGEFRRLRSVLGRTSRLKLHILHAAWNPADGHTLAAYGYWHDAASTGSQTGFANSAQRILGAHAEGGVPVGEAGKLMYYLAYAHQDRIGGGDARIDARYWRAGGGVQFRDWGMRLDHEVKGSNRGVYGFQTPLTDFYAFNGTALQFTSTPREGLVDSWLTARARLGQVELFTEAHRFRADAGGASLGREWDGTIAWHPRGDMVVRLQHARFRPGSGARSRNDVDKTWLSLTYAY